jgi:IS605 OrfB family transposase
MNKTIAILCETSLSDKKALLGLRDEFTKACNQISPIAYSDTCWNRVALHNKVYTSTRKNTSLGSQMVCNAIFSVCKAYKARRKDKKNTPVTFRTEGSVHFDKRTYSIKGDVLSLYTLEGRLKLRMKIGKFQQGYLEKGVAKEAELICKKGKWYFHLVLELPKVEQRGEHGFFALDLGENNVAAMSSGKLIRGGKIRYERDQFLARRRKLQSNGSRSAKRCLKRISGKEARRMKEENHKISKLAIQEAKKCKASHIVLEDLTNIRDRIRARKRERTRLHRWSFLQLQQQIEYKAVSEGFAVVYVKPAYSSKLCLECSSLGKRHKNTFTCHCGNQQHSDLYACEKLCRFAGSADLVTATVNPPMVASGLPIVTSFCL